MSDDCKDPRLPLVDHIRELRKRLIICLTGFVVLFLASFSVSGHIYNLLVQPFFWVVKDNKLPSFIYTSLPEKFFTDVKVSAFSALFLIFPLIAVQIYRFVAPGLYGWEKSAFRPYLIATPIFFLLGAALVYFLIMPAAIHFFLSFQQSETPGSASITLMPKVGEYLDFIMTLILAFGLCFQLPIVLTLLGQLGLIEKKNLVSGRRYAIVLVFVLAAIITPPDPISQITLALPLMGLYEIAIFSVAYIEHKRKKDRL